MTKLSLWRPVLYVRSLLFLLLFWLNTIVYAVPMVLAFLLPLMWRYRLVKVYPQVSLWLLKVCCGVRYRIEGKENLPNTPAIVFAKHQSTWETLSFILCLPPAAYVAKRELLWIPFFGWGMASLRYITVDRKAGRKAIVHIVKQAKDRLARGLWIIVFPEGTRRPVGAPLQYKIGGAVMAVQTGVPVVPIALNAGEFWPRNGLIKWPGEITMSIGPLIETRDKQAEQVRDQVQLWIETKMAEIVTPNRFPY